MTAMTPNETAKIWRSQRREAALQLYLSCPNGEQAAFVGARVADLPLDLRISPDLQEMDPRLFRSDPMGLHLAERVA